MPTGAGPTRISDSRSTHPCKSRGARNSHGRSSGAHRPRAPPIPASSPASPPASPLTSPPASQPTNAPAKPPFRMSASLLTTVTLIGSFFILCTVASYGSNYFAIVSARPIYALYPSLVAAMLVGGVCAFICYLPTVLAVLCFQILFETDIRVGGMPPPGVGPTPQTSYLELARSLMHDAANVIKLALVITPLYVMALGSSNHVAVENRSLEAAGGGQLAAALMTLKLMLVGMNEIWSLVPLVVFRLDRDAQG
ncbi:hypothetical protein C8Q79DRAFT_951131 [Trametes meyenii]|nr:hypothetical protein C8Q79DRAFT_951131 [Trametes meyenii]